MYLAVFNSLVIFLHIKFYGICLAFCSQLTKLSKDQWIQCSPNPFTIDSLFLRLLYPYMFQWSCLYYQVICSKKGL